MVEWLTLLINVREVPETGYRDWGFPWVSSVSPGKCWDSTLKLDHDRFLPHSLQFIVHISTLYSTLYNLTHRKASLNKLQRKKQTNKQNKLLYISNIPADGCIFLVIYFTYISYRYIHFYLAFTLKTDIFRFCFHFFQYSGGPVVSLFLFRNI
jgi:hypothetical protein